MKDKAIFTQTAIQFHTYLNRNVVLVFPSVLAWSVCGFNRYTHSEGKRNPRYKSVCAATADLNVYIPGLWDTKRSSFKRRDADFSSRCLGSFCFQVPKPGSGDREACSCSWCLTGQTQEPGATSKTTDPDGSGLAFWFPWERRESIGLAIHCDSRNMLCQECRSSPTQQCSWKHTQNHRTHTDVVPKSVCALLS